MIEEKDIIERTIDGEEKTLIKLGRDDFGLPKHLMQGEKKCGFLFKDGEIKEHYWEGLVSVDGYKYVYFDKMDILPISAIATTERANALKILRELAYAITKHPESFSSSLESGVIPLWRFYIVKGDGVLLLSDDLSNIFSVMQEEADRQNQVVAFLKKDTEKGYTLISQFGQLLYFALTSILPYEDDDIRNHNYAEIPLELFKEERFPSLPKETEGFINFVLHAKQREMRDIEGNRGPVENLSWFLTRTANLKWEVENLSPEKSEHTLEKMKATPAYAAFREKTERGAKRTRFWRVKGTIIIISVLALGFGLGFGIPYVKSFFDPPYTRMMEPEEIIRAVYDGQNELNVDAVSDPFKKAKAPQETEVVNLFVTSRMRYANEGFEPVVRADEWVANGKPAINEQSFVYGVDDVQIEKVDDATYIATATWYTPYAYDEEEETTSDPNAPKEVYTYRVTQRFTFTWNDRGWYNITGCETTASDYLGPETVETYSNK
jgi:hypothetical protein